MQARVVSPVHTRNPTAAQRLLKQNNARPGWLEEDLALRGALEAARAELARSAAFVRSHPSMGAEWVRATQRFREIACDLNRRIRDYNLSVPLDRLQRRRVDIESEIARARREAAT